MKTHIKYIEWRDTKGLHEDVLQAISELQFLKDELRFLRDLVVDHTLELIYGRPFEEAAKLGADLLTYDKRLKRLLKDLKDHSNNLQVLMDDIEEPNELKIYKENHYILMIAVMDFYADVKKSKRIIFKMLAEIMKKSKQKKLS